MRDMGVSSSFDGKLARFDMEKLKNKKQGSLDNHDQIRIQCTHSDQKNT